jgi:hypothetical protein
MRLSRILLNKVIRAVNETDVLQSKDWDNHELSVYDPTPRIVRNAPLVDLTDEKSDRSFKKCLKWLI